VPYSNTRDLRFAALDRVWATFEVSSFFTFLALRVSAIELSAIS